MHKSLDVIVQSVANINKTSRQLVVAFKKKTTPTFLIFCVSFLYMKSN